jgi:hypothetical protein
MGNVNQSQKVLPKQLGSSSYFKKYSRYLNQSRKQYSFNTYFNLVFYTRFIIPA